MTASATPADTAPNQVVDGVLIGLKRAEPIALLASISIFITVFTFDHQDRFQAVYNDSIVATFMFIFSFLTAVIRHSRLKIGFFDLAKDSYLRYVMFFFLGIGLLYLLLIAIEFGKLHGEVFAFLNGWTNIFLLGSALGPLREEYRREIKGKKTPEFFKFTLVIVAGYTLLACFWIGRAANYLMYGFTSQSWSDTHNLFYFNFLGLGGAAAVISWIVRNTIRKRKNKRIQPAMHPVDAKENKPPN